MRSKVPIICLHGLLLFTIALLFSRGSANSACIANANCALVQFDCDTYCIMASGCGGTCFGTLGQPDCEDTNFICSKDYELTSSAQACQSIVEGTFCNGETSTSYAGYRKSATGNCACGGSPYGCRGVGYCSCDGNAVNICAYKVCVGNCLS